MPELSTAQITLNTLKEKLSWDHLTHTTRIEVAQKWLAIAELEIRIEEIKQQEIANLIALASSPVSPLSTPEIQDRLDTLLETASARVSVIANELKK